MIRYLMAFALPLALSACATVTPVPEQVVKYDTNDIVRYIRCEVGQAIRQTYNIPANANIAAIKSGAIDQVQSASVQLDFLFEMTGQDGGGANLDALSTFTRGTLGLSVGASGELRREQNRTFRISDTFRDLMSLNCSNGLHTSANWRYPIAGRIGLDEVVQTFKKLYTDNNLADIGGGPRPTMASTLIFTTTVDMAFGINVELNPLGSRSLEISKFASTGVVSRRIDKHQLIIALSVDREKPDVAPTGKKARPARRLRPASRGPIRSMISDQVPDTPAGSASRAIDNQKLLDALQRRR